MKKIHYFGKEYTVGDDIKWVATSECGNVLAFTEEPQIFWKTWITVNAGKRIGIWGGATKDWKNSLRKVEDIIVKENELKIGDKVMVNRNVNGFKKGQIVEVYRLESDGIHLFKGDNDTFPRMCGNYGGAFLSPSEYTIIGDTKPHPHADLILKYAQIAQYDDKPWEYFEYETSTGWTPCLSMAAFNENVNYRLKPQEPKIQVGQIWVSKEGVEVTVNVQSNEDTVVFMFKVGGMTYRSTSSYGDFLQNFKLKGE